VIRKSVEMSSFTLYLLILKHRDVVKGKKKKKHRKISKSTTNQDKVIYVKRT